MNTNQLWQLYKQRVDDCDGQLGQAIWSFEEELSDDSWETMWSLSEELSKLADAHWDLMYAFLLMDKKYIDKLAE